MSDIDEKKEDAGFIPNPKELDGVPGMFVFIYMYIKRCLTSLLQPHE